MWSGEQVRADLADWQLTLTLTLTLTRCARALGPPSRRAQYYNLLLTTYYYLLTTYYLRLTILTTCYLLPTCTYYLLLTTCYLLLTTSPAFGHRAPLPTSTPADLLPLLLLPHPRRNGSPRRS